MQENIKGPDTDYLFSCLCVTALLDLYFTFQSYSCRQSKQQFFKSNPSYVMLEQKVPHHKFKRASHQALPA